MTNQPTQKHDDTWLIKLFRNFEEIIPSDKSDVDWSVTTDFKVFSEYLIKDIQEMQEQSKNPDDEYLYDVCRHAFNILDWMKLIVEDAGFPTFAKAWEELFEKHFGDKHILQNLYDNCFEKWVSEKSGQHKIGENFYNILGGKIYYRNRLGQWFEVDKKTVFDLKPKKKLIEDNGVNEQLNDEYKETWHDAILRRWDEKKFQGVLPDDFLEFSGKETSPEEYFDFTIVQIRALLKNPVSISELERWSGGEITDLEDMVKIASFVLDMVRKRRKDDSHTLYLLRDCLMFHEAQKTIDILNGEDTSSDQALVGRKLLSHKPGEWGFYAVILDALYSAHLRYPINFSEFYNEFSRLMDMFVSLNPKFATVISNLADYIKEHIQTDKNKIIVFDIGFQGSIALLTKYIIDRHIGPSGSNGNVATDIKIGVGAEWSKKLFGHRFESDCFPLLNCVQLMARSDALYHYKAGSLTSGKLRIEMGDEKSQHQAAIELVVLVMVVLLGETNK